MDTSSPLGSWLESDLKKGGSEGVRSEGVTSGVRSEGVTLGVRSEGVTSGVRSEGVTKPPTIPLPHPSLLAGTVDTPMAASRDRGYTHRC